MEQNTSKWVVNIENFGWIHSLFECRWESCYCVSQSEVAERFQNLWQNSLEYCISTEGLNLLVRVLVQTRNELWFIAIAECLLIHDALNKFQDLVVTGWYNNVMVASFNSKVQDAEEQGDILSDFEHMRNLRSHILDRQLGKVLPRVSVEDKWEALRVDWQRFVDFFWGILIRKHSWLKYIQIHPEVWDDSLNEKTVVHLRLVSCHIHGGHKFDAQSSNCGVPVCSTNNIFDQDSDHVFLVRLRTDNLLVTSWELF